MAYDGRPFRGFAAQGGQPTVAGALGVAIARTVRLAASPPLVCAGRTDAGVHALGQVLHVDLPDAFDADLAHALNRQLAPAVVVRSAGVAPPGFDARRSAIWRRYRYLVWNAAVPDPLLAPLSWHVAEPLDRRAMQTAVDPLIGEHDFRSFCRRPPGAGPDEPLTRRVLDARWRAVPATADDGEARRSGVLLRLDVVASSFCHQMVRSVAAVLVDAGRGRASAATVMELLAAGSRAGAPRPAPPHGLCLMGVGYPDAPGSGDGSPPRSRALPGAGHAT